jgi:hypothetical protein
MSLANLKVYNQYAYTTFLELLNHNIALFNAATKGGLVLRSGANQGDFSDIALYSRISGLVRRRDAYGTGTVNAKQLAMLQQTSVKVAAGTPPVDITPHYWQWIMRDPAEAGIMLGKQLAEETLSDMLAVAVKAHIAALSNVGATVVHDGTAGTMTLQKLVNGAALYGDRAQEIMCWVMHSKVLFDLYGSALTNGQQLFVFGNVKVQQDGFGRPLIVTDQPDLAYTSSGTKYHTLGLVQGSALIEQNPDYVENLETKNGDENITRTWQAQWSYNVGLKGFAWDKTAGGASPTNAALATGTNWDRFATETKDLAGVIVNTT